ncbi:hypothetical protein N658DRAFT_554228 [Parathielavia hyrcaniae]|uniref:Uncharacterized protein n=1 Tax=Parathielavia hyrcaniae TaxID=113614 RepID=A0AAN6Q5Q9_9PEZI|nr:hypothetical protein N658DRAFT_554228 [Parathielavia hyrcaniae]
MLEFKVPDPLADQFKSSGQIPSKMPSSPQILTPPGPAPPILSVDEYPSVFDSDDEFESVDDSTPPGSEITFRRRVVPPLKQTSSKTVSLLTMQLRRYREAATAFDDSERLNDNFDGHVKPSSQSQWNQQFPRKSQLETILEQDELEIDEVASTSIQSLDRDSDDETPETQRPIHDQANACFKGKQKTSIFGAIKKTIITNFKRLKSITLPRQKKLQQAIPEQDEEEFDPYFLFFGNGQDQGIAPSLPVHSPLFGTATSGTEDSVTNTDTEEEVDGIQPQSLQPKLRPVCQQLPTPSAPINIPLTRGQQQFITERDNLCMPFHIGWAKDNRQISNAGPLHLRRSGVSYIEADSDWVCCCDAANSRFEFLCGRCKVHAKGACCDSEVFEQLMRGLALALGECGER